MERAREPVTEPWRATARRTGSIALAVGLGAGLYQGRVVVVPLVTLAALWFSLGGHFAEVFFLDRLGQRIAGRAAQVGVRLVYWFVAGSVLYAGALATVAILGGRGASRWPWWAGGVFFVALELAVHSLLRARGLPSFYDGRG